MKKFFKNLGLFVLLLVCAAPLIFVISWGAYELEQQYNVNAVDDDTVITSQVFTGSQIILPADYLYGNVTAMQRSARDVCFQFRFSYDPQDDGGTVSFITEAVIFDYSTGSSNVQTTITPTYLTVASQSFSVDDLPSSPFYVMIAAFNPFRDVYMAFSATTYDVSNIIGVTITPNFTQLTYFNFGSNSVVFNMTEIRYFNSDGDYFAFYVASPLTSSDFVSRTYYFETVLTSTDGYQQGYDAGYDFGYSRGTDFGYQSGLRAGRQLGYNNGFSDGVASANEYTFLGLIGAVIDAPLTAFVSLLNFEVFGFNMLNLLTGLFTLAVIIFIVRLVLGKG